MSLFKRLRDLTLSNIYALVEKAEDPVKLLDQYIRDMVTDVEEAEKAVAAQIAIEKKFKILYEEQAALVQKRTEQAEKAVQADKIDLARRALEDKKVADQKAEEYKTAYEQNKAAAQQLRSKLSEMQKQVNEMKNKRETLVARANAAKAQTQINKAMAGFGTDTAKAGLKRMEEKVLEMESRAEASNELFTKEKSLDDEFAALDKDQDIEDELAALMKKHQKE
ncbi:phage-shock protein [Aneurinibacillus migulanus]|uniref:Phage shock protein A (PspA) family protein n=1 Tax=Aneurinibacillus migulanus TaxID=47500 RepID=A0A0D1Y5L4_ANEMI|nr:PspA/IM30 family protein [Aneurinibacillus migulanus]KIV58430.1 phage-shock protein [Aneurinibacillus migulanus]KIV59668.1 phage-shock protein [Aneurinibacillus migulanus]KON90817.1 phage-shock protein [Aneurinibacillus migulanus]KPD09858.1 phage-shock protein [Aneurinibacillus migulanus]MCP1356510.1 PspA/IM30 family protein [Aneurinibacillus migulanus]